MVQGAPQVAGRFDAEVRMYKAPPPEVSSEQFYETDPSKPYQRGFALQNVSPLPITYAEHVSAQGHWGEVLREYMRDYNHWAVMGALCEFLPRFENSVTLARRPTATDCRWPTSPTRCATTTVKSKEPLKESKKRSCVPPGRPRPSPSSVTPTWWWLSHGLRRTARGGQR